MVALRFLCTIKKVNVLDQQLFGARKSILNDVIIAHRNGKIINYTTNDPSVDEDKYPNIKTDITNTPELAFLSKELRALRPFSEMGERPKDQ